MRLFQISKVENDYSREMNSNIAKIKKINEVIPKLSDISNSKTIFRRNFYKNSNVAIHY